MILILNEPYSAAIALDLDKKDEKLTIVLDLGSSSLTVTAMTFDGGAFDNLAISYDKQLGGQEFDRCLANHFMQLIKERNPTIEIKEERLTM